MAFEKGDRLESAAKTNRLFLVTSMELTLGSSASFSTYLRYLQAWLTIVEVILPGGRATRMHCLWMAPCSMPSTNVVL